MKSIKTLKNSQSDLSSKELSSRFLDEVSGAGKSFSRHDRHYRDSVGGSGAYWKAIETPRPIEP